jgi:hypothetical protein
MLPETKTRKSHSLLLASSAVERFADDYLASRHWEAMSVCRIDSTLVQVVLVFRRPISDRGCLAREIQPPAGRAPLIFVFGQKPSSFCRREGGMNES